jgi:preprotein translocase subunit SecB
MNLSLMHIDSIFLLSLRIDANPNWIPKDGYKKIMEEVEPEFHFNVFKHPQGMRFSVQLKIRLSCPQVPESPFLSVESDLLGIYSLPDGVTEDQVREYVPTLCLVNLYSLARGIVAQATGMCPSGTLYLPMVDMNKVVKQHNEKVKQLRLQSGIFEGSDTIKAAGQKKKSAKRAKVDK